MSFKLFISFLLALISAQMVAYNVTFRLQMNGVNGFTTPEVNGTFNGWCGACNPMNDANGDGIWEAVIALPAGYFEYKFSADNWSQQENLTVGSSCTATTGAYTNRTLNVSSNVVLPVVCWGSCSSCTISTVNFQVNMAAVPNFTTPYVSGTFNNWCGNCNPMSDPDGDYVYSASIPLLNGYYEYKFSYDNWAGAENLVVGSPCTVTNYGFTNRFVQVAQAQTLPIVCWSSCDGPSGSASIPTIQIQLTSGSNPGCVNSELVFSATTSNVTSTPVYQWKIDGVAVGSNAPSLTLMDINNGQVVSCELIGAAGCAVSGSVYSNEIVVSRITSQTPSVAISAGSNSPFCAGQQVTFTAISTNGGNSPSYQWMINGVNVGANSATYSSASLQQGDVVSCKLTSNAICQSSDWNMIWNDEFNGAALDASKWQPETGATGWGNNELQNYTGSSNNVQFSNGELHIVARNDGPAGQQYSSARLITKNLFSLKYGRVKGRIRIPSGQGIWPAFWMLGANIDQTPWPGCGEIDIMEHINNENKIYGTAHWNNGGLNSNSGNLVTSVSGYHEYAVEWDSLSIRFFMDGALYHQHSVSQSNGSSDEFTKPFFLLLNVAVGGNWPGYPNSTTIFPAVMDVDFVRVWQRNVSPSNVPVLSNVISVSTVQPVIWYQDSDADGYGNSAVSLSACLQPSGYVSASGDCNDQSGSIYPGAIESCNNSVDDNCNGQINEGCCTGAPAAPTSISGPYGVCRSTSGNVFTTPAVSGATSYLWTLPTGATGYSTTNSIVVSVSATYTTGNMSVRAVGPCGTSLAYSKSLVAITAVPAIPTTISGPSVNVCAGTTQTYSCTSVTSASSYQWTAPANATIVSGQGTQTVSIAFDANFSANGSVSVKAQNCFGLSGSRSLLVYRVPAMPGAISGSVNNICPGSTQTYSVVAVAGATSYVWTAPVNASIASGQGTNSITLLFNSAFVSGSVSVVAASSCGQSVSRTLALSKNPPLPAVITGQSTNLCGGGQFAYSTSAVSGATSYNWTVPSGCSIAVNNGVSISLNIPSTFLSGTLSVRANNSCGGSSVRSLSLTRLPATPASITGPSSSCPNQTGLVFSTPAVTGVTQLWTTPAGVVIVSGQGTTSINCNWGSVVGSVSVKNVNTCGQSAAATKSVALATCMSVMDETDINPNFSSLEMVVFPNPACGPFTISASASTQGVIVNALGQEVATFYLNAENHYAVMIHEIPTGLYFIKSVDSDLPPMRLIKVK